MLVSREILTFCWNVPCRPCGRKMGSEQSSSFLKITLMEGFIDAEEEGSMREVVMPKFEHKISTVLQYKDELSGILGGSEFELAWDAEAGTWAIRPVDDRQLSLFDNSHGDA